MSQVNDFRNSLMAAGDDKELQRDIINAWVESSCGAFEVEGLDIPGLPVPMSGFIVILDDRGSGGPPQIVLLTDKTFIGGETEDGQWQFAAEMMNLPEFEKHIETSLRNAYKDEEVAETMSHFRESRAIMRRNFL